MKSSLAGLACLLGSALALPSSSRPAEISARAGSFPSVSGSQFTIDGTTGYFKGTNCYWCSFLTNNADIDTALDHISGAGIKILRVWGFNDVTTKPTDGSVYFQYLSSSGSEINTGDDGLGRLDYLVSAADQRGLKLIIPFVNSWNDYGGMQAYATAFGGAHNDFYTSDAMQTQYKNYIQAVVSRYVNSNAIFAWELANESRCNGCDTSVIYNWAQATSQYVKSIDGNHMVTLGDEGMGLQGDSSYPYGTSEGNDWSKNLGISTLDFGTMHLYPSSWGTSFDWGNKWISDHAAACASAGKPCFLEEYGSPSDHCTNEGPWQKTSTSTAGMGGDAFWQFGDTLSNGKSADDTFTIYYGSDDWTCLVTNHP